MIVATAGHVDHGKTTLVKALTGIDTDRLAEEKRRGMSIDLGFAHADLGAGVPISFVDVPGHDRFIRNMAAGVAAVDVALLVVAADDGPMPQTHEHLAILEWLGVPRCIVALTKIDRIDDARADAARAETAALLATTRYRGAPILAVAAPAAIGLDGLRAALRTPFDSAGSARVHGRFRLAVDRHFTLAGAGTIVTGTVVAGSAVVGAALIVSPHGTAVRVRGIQVQGRPVDAARTGERCALNLAGTELKRTAIGRGDWIVDPAAHAPTDRLDVRLGAARDLDRPLRHDALLQLHLGATTVGARVALLERRTLEPGATGLAQLVLERPIGALHGDRFIVRDAARNRTAGGGSVIDPFGPVRGRARPERLAALGALALPTPAEALSALVDQSMAAIDIHRFSQARNLGANEADDLVRGKQALTVVHAGRVATGSAAGPSGPTATSWAVATIRWRALLDTLGASLDQLHDAEPDRVGATESDLTQRIAADPLAPLVPAALATLLAGGTIVRDGFCLRRPGHRARLSNADQALLDRVCAQLHAAGLRPPIVGDLAAALETPLPALLGDLVSLARRGHLVQVAKNRFFLPATVHALADIATELARSAGDAGFNAAAYRDRSGLGRNLTIEVLEHLDRTGVTRFRDGRRRLTEPAPVVT
jgi:selenocysteine-specific elongation factor